ncbi:hypothetical protein LV84_04292 [Algoriphagus ratkowskyi]|uniref:Natural product n=1 Tax=Algoriphagus ratkowskyi TaxID=57028 RepID=A0A2W7QKZ9_9BACT|nr:hypothetical protein [Algoriphagus ratkowskyi]PZX49104.1 hypothetical protein LV84_04292 [Algoriphagus ratkowskyi]TXD75337.1 hypothetical protein ESW18_20875 [Algoriphagus ratkowskyi]
MKKLSLGKLKLRSEEVLQRSHLANIFGGYDYDCYCGFTGGCGENDPFSVSRNSLEEALQYAASQCNGCGATCEGAYP